MTKQDDSGTVAAGVLAQLFDCDERTIRDLVERGIVIRAERGKYVLSQSIRNYVRHLREQAAGRGGEEHQTTLTHERARFARAQATAVELKNQILAGNLLEAAAVENTWSTILSTIRSFMLALPGQIAQALPHLTRADIDTIDRLIRDALNAAADDMGGDQ